MTVGAFKLSPGTAYGAMRLAPIEPSLIDDVKRANARELHKKLQIGIGQTVGAELYAGPGSATWIPVPGGYAAQWEVTSPGAEAMRVELTFLGIAPDAHVRFAGRGQIETVYGPYDASEFAAGSGSQWSPVLAGESAIIEVFVGSLPPPGPLLAIEQVSHLFVKPWDPAADSLAKASGTCEVDFICRAASDAALASTGKSVAKMAFSDGTGSGSTYLCTGTLLNPVGGSGIPYFYSANHCISTQAAASTLTTHWFYDRTGCGSGSTSSNYVQLTGGATLLYASADSDGLLLRLNSSPPGGSVLAGWDSATVSTGAAVTAIHHPAGDWKKVSLGTVGGFGDPYGSGSAFIVSNWTSTTTGVTEGGSSGSGLFTFNGAQYNFRGGLYGGPSSCTAPASSLHDYYSRFDQVYPAIQQYLNPSGSCTYTLSPTSASVSAVATTGTFGVTTSAGCAWSATSNAPAWLTSSSSGNGNGTVSYSIAANSGATRKGTLTVGGIQFTVTQQAPAAGGVNILANPGFETGTASWTQSATGGYPIIVQDASVARSGSWYAWLGGYDNGVDTLYQLVSIPAGGSASLQFWYQIVSDEDPGTIPYDTLTVSINSASTGTVLARLTTLSNADRTTGWQQSAAYDLSAYAGQTVRLVFQARTDYALITNFYIDDLTLTFTQAASCAYSITPTSAAPAASGGTDSISVTTATGCAWTATSGASWLTVTSGASGSGNGTVGYSVAANAGAARTGTITIAGQTLTVTQSGAAGASTNYQGLWWNSPANTESGWGINFAHQGDVIFATWFTYDLTGRAWWLSMTANKTADRTYTGSLIQTGGPPFSAVPFDPTGVNRATVGTGTLNFSDADNGTFAYTVNGLSQIKTIVRQVFGPVPTCTYGARPNLAQATNYQDLWWVVAGAESGWGINLTHQGDNIFAAWFTYDVDGAPLWLSVTAAKVSSGVYSGQLIRTAGPPFNAVPFNPASVTRTVVGTATFTFANGNSATFAYTVNGVAQIKTITRQLFAPPAGTLCQ